MATGSGSGSGGGDRKSSWNCFSCFSPKKDPSQDPLLQVTEEEVAQPVPTVHAPPPAPATQQQGSNPADASGSSSVPSGESNYQNAGSLGNLIKKILMSCFQVTEEHRPLPHMQIPSNDPHVEQMAPATTQQQEQQGSYSLDPEALKALWNTPERSKSLENLGFGTGGRQEAEINRGFFRGSASNLKLHTGSCSLLPGNKRKLNALWNTAERALSFQNLGFGTAGRQEAEIISTRREDEPLASGSSDLNLPTEPEGPDGRQCRICRAVNKPRLNRWSDVCQHLFCDVCLNEYVDLDMIIETNAWRVQCPEEGCNETQTAEDCRRFLPEEFCDIWVTSIPEEARNT